MKETDAFRASEAARKTLKEKIGRFDSLSEWLSQWQRQTQGEVIMEVWPHAEWGEYGWHKTMEPNLASLSEQFPDWTMKFDDNVLIAKNRIAFLDRLPERPTAALVRLIQNTLRREETEPKKAAKPSDPEGSPQDAREPRRPSFGDRVNYAAAAINYAPWKPSEYTHLYWGLRLEDRDSGLPLEYFWSQLTSDQREAWKQEKYLPLSVLGNDRLQTLRRYILRFGPQPGRYAIHETYANSHSRLFYPFNNQDTTIP